MIKIVVDGGHSTVRYAAEELRKYLKRVTGDEVEIGECVCPGGGLDIHVGIAGDIDGVSPIEVADAELDDAISIVVMGGGGYIAGVNPRSVLLAVYRYLTEIGCRWVRPGEDGELIPRIEMLPDVKLDEKPSYRHRGVCIEGASSVEHVNAMVDWMPKVGFNGYFIQFREAHTFFDRWYAHTNNPTLKGEHITREQAQECTKQVVDEIKKRDMLYHGVGHGWTCEPFGISGLGWEKDERDLPEEISQYLAEVNGERKLWGGVALNTNLCYGNPVVREKVINEIANYSEQHPEIDIMHFWLADGTNNHCECELCRDTRPADFYVMMLNELDDLLTERGLKTRIVFLIYVDLLWPPEKEKIKNQDRFILMFAPITRTYSEPFAAGAEVPELKPFERNKLKFPRSVAENIAYLRAWQKDFPGDSFDFDYHLMWDHFKDPGFTPVSYILSKDMKGLKDIGINGYVSCQEQRVFMPTGLPMTVMGLTLWNRDAELEDIENDYYPAAFGADWKQAKEWLAKLSELVDPVYLRGEKDRVNPESAGKYSKLPAVVDEFMPVIEQNMKSDNACWARSWDYLRWNGEIWKRIAPALEAVASGDKDLAAERWKSAQEFIQEHEMEYHPGLDMFFFISTLNWFFS